MSTETAAVAVSDASPRQFLRQLARRPMLLGSSLVLMVVVLLALLAPLLTPYDPTKTSLSLVLAPPSAAHPLGGDGVGHDVLARLLWGSGASLMAGAIATGVAVLVGVPAGLIAGYRRGRFDTVSSWFADALLAIPGIVALLVVVSVFGTAITPTMIALGILFAPNFFRLSRATVVQVRKELYIDAAKISGLSATRIVFRHILAVVATPILIQASLTAGVAIIVQSGLAFLGIGNALEPSWGAMVNDAYRNNVAAPQLILWPGLAIGITAAALAIVGSSLSDALNRSGGRFRTARPDRRAQRRQTHEDAVRRAASAADVDGHLVVEGLRVSYPSEAGLREVVRGVSFSVNRGECLGIVGESGSGKSQTAFAVLGLLPSEAVRQADRIQLDGIDLITARERDLDRLRVTRIAYIPQDPMSNLDPVYTIGAQMIETIRAHERVSQRAARARAQELLGQVGIVDPARTLAAYPHEISGGMAQRVLIAIAVSCDPEVVIADEPTTALDVTVQAEVLALLRRLQRERNLAVVLVTHNLGVVADICDRVAVMRDGEIVETADVFTLFRDPQHPYTKELLGSTLSGAEPRTRLLGRASAASRASVETEPEGESS
ncbi:MAG TPA: dipeptide/oligopeptide/nickel ABC transporter permease/ATP-binding protein [Pseudolysinimonas sp.]|nr:dipeptide/oligopeptide/nickel ABC transporter permease/ATP-binding protein [Pseudolysinimonas sp.]